MKIKASSVTDAVPLISAERFKEFRDFARNDSHGVTLHQHSTCVSGSFMPLVALTEIALRNCVDEAMAQYFGRADWLVNPPPVFPLKSEETTRIARGIRDAQRTMYSKLTNQEKQALDAVAYPTGIPPNATHAQRVKARQKAITVPQGKVIAQLTIYFWKRLFSSDYDATLWRPILKKLFPSKKITRADVAQHLERIYVIRNRIAHHEVLLARHLAGVPEAFGFIAMNLRPMNAASEEALSDLLYSHMRETGFRITAMRKFAEWVVRPRRFFWRSFLS